MQLAFLWLEDVARSPAGIELVSDHADRYSGFFVIVRNRALYQLAIRHSRGESRHHHYTQVNRRPELFDEDPDWDDTEPFSR